MGVGNSAGGANANWEGAGVVAGLKSAGRVWVGSCQSGMGYRVRILIFLLVLDGFIFCRYGAAAG